MVEGARVTRRWLAIGADYIHNIFVPTTVHIPPPLLTAVDRKARALRISRNRLIVRALQHEVEERGWSPGFFEQLREVDRGAAATLDGSMAVVHAARRSKTPPRL